jgi:hypothetical protein
MNTDIVARSKITYIFTKYQALVVLEANKAAAFGIKVPFKIFLVSLKVCLVLKSGWRVLLNQLCIDQFLKQCSL